jgi:hypothetical protein
MTFLNFLVALLVITVLGAGVVGVALIAFTVWLNDTLNQQDVADEQVATMEDGQ